MIDEKVGELQQRPGGTPLMSQIQNAAFEMKTYELTTHNRGKMVCFSPFQQANAEKNLFLTLYDVVTNNFRS